MATITAFTTQETFVWNLPGILKRKFGRKRGKNLKLVYTYNIVTIVVIRKPNFPQNARLNAN